MSSLQDFEIARAKLEEDARNSDLANLAMADKYVTDAIAHLENHVIRGMKELRHRIRNCAISPGDHKEVRKLYEEAQRLRRD